MNSIQLKPTNYFLFVYINYIRPMLIILKNIMKQQKITIFYAKSLQKQLILWYN